MADNSVDVQTQGKQGETSTVKICVGNFGIAGNLRDSLKSEMQKGK